MPDISEKLRKYVKLSREQRKKMRRWLSRQSEEMELEAFVRQQKYYFELSRYKDENRSLLYYAAHTLAISEIYDQMNPKKGKNKIIDIRKVPDVTGLQMKYIVRSKNSKKYDRLLNLKNKILMLKDEQNLSFRQISEFLLRYHKLEVSHAYIATFYQNMKDTK